MNRRGNKTSLMDVDSIHICWIQHFVHRYTWPPVLGIQTIAQRCSVERNICIWMCGKICIKINNDIRKRKITLQWNAYIHVNRAHSEVFYTFEEIRSQVGVFKITENLQNYADVAKFDKLY